jgi:hypothetical protein
MAGIILIAAICLNNMLPHPTPLVVITTSGEAAFGPVGLIQRDGWGFGRVDSPPVLSRAWGSEFPRP